MGSSKRSLRVADLIQREVAQCLQRKVNDPRLAKLSIVEVDVSPDGKSAKIYYTLLDPNDLDDVKKALEKASGFIQRYLAQNVEIRISGQLMVCCFSINRLVCRLTMPCKR